MCFVTCGQQRVINALEVGQVKVNVDGIYRTWRMEYRGEYTSRLILRGGRRAFSYSVGDKLGSLFCRGFALSWAG